MIVERADFLRKVSCLHAGGGHEVLDHRCLREAETLIGGKEEGLIAAVVEMWQNDRTASGGAVIIRYDVRFIGTVGAVGDGIQAAVLEVPEKPSRAGDSCLIWLQL